MLWWVVCSRTLGALQKWLALPVNQTFVHHFIVFPCNWSSNTFWSITCYCWTRGCGLNVVRSNRNNLIKWKPDGMKASHDETFYPQRHCCYVLKSFIIFILSLITAGQHVCSETADLPCGSPLTYISILQGSAYILYPSLSSLSAFFWVCATDEAQSKQWEWKVNSKMRKSMQWIIKRAAAPAACNPTHCSAAQEPLSWGLKQHFLWYKSANYSRPWGGFHMEPHIYSVQDACCVAEAGQISWERVKTVLCSRFLHERGVH